METETKKIKVQRLVIVLAIIIALIAGFIFFNSSNQEDVQNVPQVDRSEGGEL